MKNETKIEKIEKELIESLNLGSVTLIVTHPGAAHFDDFGICGYLQYLSQKYFGRYIEIARRDPVLEELEKKSVLVLDVGMQYDPTKNNFDHHQRDDALAFENATSLVLKEVPELYNAFKESFQWFYAKQILDAKGPMKAALEFGYDKFQFEFSSPVEKFILKAFENINGLTPESFFMYDILAKFGKDIFFSIESFVENLAFLEENAKVQSFYNDNQDEIPILIIPSKEIRASRAYKEAWEKKNKKIIAGSICYDNRGSDSGWTLYRYNDHPCLDFAKIDQNDGVLYANKDGFIAKTKDRIALEEVIELVKLSIVEN